MKHYYIYFNIEKDKYYYLYNSNEIIKCLLNKKNILLLGDSTLQTIFIELNSLAFNIENIPSLIINQSLIKTINYTINFKHYDSRNYRKQTVFYTDFNYKNS